MSTAPNPSPEDRQATRVALEMVRLTLNGEISDALREWFASDDTPDERARVAIALAQIAATMGEQLTDRLQASAWLTRATRGLGQL